MTELMSALFTWVVLTMGVPASSIQSIDIDFAPAKEIQMVVCNNTGCEDTIMLGKDGRILAARDVGWGDPIASAMMVRTTVSSIQLQVSAGGDMAKFKSREKEFNEEATGIVRQYLVKRGRLLEAKI